MRRTFVLGGTVPKIGLSLLLFIKIQLKWQKDLMLQVFASPTGILWQMSLKKWRLPYNW